MQNLTITISTQSAEIHDDNTLPELVMIDGIACCTSLQVADHFEKQHKNVMRDIDETITQVIETSEKLKSGLPETLFKKTDYTLTNNFGHPVKKPMYLLTEDGFTLLAMGYTGVKAMGYKLRYMAAFKQMREALKNITPAPQARPALINPRDLCLLKAAVDSSVHSTLARNSNKEAVENYLKVMFRVDKLELIPESQAQAARNAVQQVNTYVNDLRSMLIGFEKEAFSGYITGNAPHIPSLKRKYKAALDAAKPQTPDIAKLVARDWLSKNGLMTA